jgi:hypothetical protein
MILAVMATTAACHWMNSWDFSIEGARSYLGMSQADIEKRIKQLEVKP